MNITQPARNAAVRIAQSHIDMNPREDVVASIASEIQQAINLVRANESTYFIMQEGDQKESQFWDGDKWAGADARKAYLDFDEAIKEYRKVNLAFTSKVTIAHSSPGGIVRYQPL